MPGPEPTWDDLTSDYVMRPKRPTPRHRAEKRRWADLRQDGGQRLTAARRGLRASLRAALIGSGTPAGGLTLLAHPQRNDRTTT